MLVFDLAVGDSIVAGDVSLTLKFKKGSKARVAVDAPTEKKVDMIRAVDAALKKAREKSIFPRLRDPSQSDITDSA
jgi:sRNA-binding carbon storage regulator CsrA